VGCEIVAHRSSRKIEFAQSLAEPSPHNSLIATEAPSSTRDGALDSQALLGLVLPPP
jgi:hypothetical protein